VGGEAANAVGEKIKQIAAKRQVLFHHASAHVPARGDDHMF